MQPLDEVLPFFSKNREFLAAPFHDPLPTSDVLDFILNSPFHLYHGLILRSEIATLCSSPQLATAWHELCKACERIIMCCLPTTAPAAERSNHSQKLMSQFLHNERLQSARNEFRRQFIKSADIQQVINVFLPMFNLWKAKKEEQRSVDPEINFVPAAIRNALIKLNCQANYQALMQDPSFYIFGDCTEIAKFLEKQPSLVPFFIQLSLTPSYLSFVELWYQEKKLLRLREQRTVLNDFQLSLTLFSENCPDSIALSEKPKIRSMLTISQKLMRSIGESSYVNSPVSLVPKLLAQIARTKDQYAMLCELDVICRTMLPLLIADRAMRIYWPLIRELFVKMIGYQPINQFYFILQSLANVVSDSEHMLELRTNLEVVMQQIENYLSQESCARPLAVSNYGDVNYPFLLRKIIPMIVELERILPTTLPATCGDWSALYVEWRRLLSCRDIKFENRIMMQKHILLTYICNKSDTLGINCLKIVSMIHEFFSKDIFSHYSELEKFHNDLHTECELLINQSEGIQLQHLLELLEEHTDADVSDNIHRLAVMREKLNYLYDVYAILSMVGLTFNSPAARANWHQWQQRVCQLNFICNIAGLVGREDELPSLKTVLAECSMKLKNYEQCLPAQRDEGIFAALDRSWQEIKFDQLLTLGGKILFPQLAHEAISRNSDTSCGDSPVIDDASEPNRILAQVFPSPH